MANWCTSRCLPLLARISVLPGLIHLGRLLRPPNSGCFHQVHLLILAWTSLKPEPFLSQSIPNKSLFCTCKNCFIFPSRYCLSVIYLLSAMEVCYALHIEMRCLVPEIPQYELLSFHFSHPEKFPVQVLDLGSSMYVWVSSSMAMNNMALAMPMAKFGSPASTQLLPGDYSILLAQAQGVCFCIACGKAAAFKWQMRLYK